MEKNRRQLIILGNGTDWCKRSLQKLSARNDTFFVDSDNLTNDEKKEFFIKGFYGRVNKKIYIPFKFIWYDTFLETLEKKFPINNNTCILFFDRNKFAYDYKFLRFLKKKYPSIKLAYIFTNIVKHTAATEIGYLNKLNQWYDAVFAFDPNDAEKYNFHYSPLIYDADSNYIKPVAPEYAFYVGKAKDRLQYLIGIYERLKALHIKCDFHIVEVPENEQKYKDEIIYNKPLTYDECVSKIKGSMCLIDAIQGGSAGLTIKNCEAISYSKKLITTNNEIKKYPFYDSRYIKVISDPKEIDKDFFEKNKDVNYPEIGRKYFSSDSFWNRLWSVLDE